MRVGIVCCGMGEGATSRVIKTVAQTAERVGFSSFWVGEHIVLFEKAAEADYPYSNSDSGGAAEWLIDPNTALSDPIIGMSWAAAVTETIEIGSSIIILPQRNPVVLAKELATLDAFSGGRIILGIGTGWAKQEYQAIGADWAGRGKRMDEYIDALHTLWRENPSTFHGETISFDRAYLFPKPTRNIPILSGGESDAVLKRIARSGDGWLPVNVKIEDMKAQIDKLRRLTKEQGRDPDQLRIIKIIASQHTKDDLKRLRDAGVTEFLLSSFGELSFAQNELVAGIEDFCRRFVDVAATL